jgi:prolyl oligopeptidase
MKYLLIFILTINFSSGQEVSYPVTKQQDVIDTIWHTPVHDPYRWLEDIHSEETKAWLNEQEAVRDKYAGKLTESIAEHLKNYSRIRSKRISKQGIYYFTFMTTGDESSSLYYQTQPFEEKHLLFNPNTLSDKDVIAIDGITLSANNKTLAIVLSKNGSDWKSIRFIDMEHKKLLNDTIRFVKYSPVYWSENGVFYIQYDAEDEAESFKKQIMVKGLRYHKLGTSQNEDIDIFIPSTYKDEFSFQVTPLEKYLILYQKKKLGGSVFKFVSCRNLPLKKEEDFRDFIQFDTKKYYSVIGEIGNELLVATNQNAKNGVLMEFNPDKLNAFKSFNPQFKERMQYSAIINENKIVSLYDGDKRSFAVVFDSTGAKQKTWTIPEGFVFSGLSYSKGDSVLVYSFSSFINPASVYQINLNTYQQSSISETIVPFSFSELTTEMVYYYSKDSTQIPMYLTHKKNIRLDGNNPVILYGYGGFGISMKPFFEVGNIPFLNSGGVLAVPQLRGGGDFPGWHQLGSRLNKQNTFDDFIAAAEYLIREKYTSPQRLAILGGSHGGLVVTACMVQRPELFKVAVSESGVMDMLRYHLYNIGYKREEEYGNINDSADFVNLYRYSPVNNVKKGVEYPATLLVASDNDDRVNPFQSFKFLAQLQTNGSKKNPCILYYVPNAGHAGSRIYDERMKQKAFVYAFIYKYLGMEKNLYFED